MPTTALATAVRFDDSMMYVSLADGRIVAVPIGWFPLLREATQEQIQNCQIDGGGISLQWPDIDEDLSVGGLLAGGDPRSL